MDWVSFLFLFPKSHAFLKYRLISGRFPALRSAEMGRALVKTRCLAVAYIDKDEDAIGRWALPKGLLR